MLAWEALYWFENFEADFSESLQGEPTQSLAWCWSQARLGNVKQLPVFNMERQEFCFLLSPFFSLNRLCFIKISVSHNRVCVCVCVLRGQLVKNV